MKKSTKNIIPNNNKTLNIDIINSSQTEEARLIIFL